MNKTIQSILSVGVKHEINANTTSNSSDVMLRNGKQRRSIDEAMMIKKQSTTKKQ